MKQEIADIRNAFDEENKIPVKVESSLKKIEKTHDDLKAEIKTQSETIDKKDEDINGLYKESKKRQTKLQEQEREIDTLKSEKDKILKDTEHEDYDELFKYKTDNEAKLAEKKITIRKQFIEKHNALKDHSDYDKCKGGYNLPEEKDGKLDWESLDDDTMVANANKLKEHEGLGFFSDGTGGHDEPKGGKGKTEETQIFKKGTFKV